MSIEAVVSEEKLEYVLELLDRDIEEEGQIIDKKTGDPDRFSGGDTATKDQVGYIAPGSVEFVKDDITDLVDYFEEKETE